MFWVRKSCSAVRLSGKLFHARSLSGSSNSVGNATGTFSFARSSQGIANPPPVVNEPFKHYAKGSQERKDLVQALAELRKQAESGNVLDVPCVVNGKEIRTGDVHRQLLPTDHKHAVCTFHNANAQVIESAIDASVKAKVHWETLPVEHRAAVFLKAADLMSTKYRAQVCAAVMLGTGKNAWQAEIDAAVELIDFWRFSVKYMYELYAQQPPEHSQQTWNRMEFRALEGFVLAISPFNFAAIGSNLCSSPAVLGNSCIWKPASTAVLGNYLTYKVLEEAGLPAGVINFLPSSGSMIGKVCFNSPHLAGLHFTGSTSTFNHIWRQMAANLEVYRSYPRIVGETGGKNFHFLHSSADVTNAVMNTVRGAYEYSGQKCSAASRAYVPSNLWPEFKQLLVETLKTVKVGQPDEMDTFMTSVIDAASFKQIKGYIDRAKQSSSCSILYGGKCDDSRGYFVEPTVIMTTDPRYETMVQEIFGPVLTIHVYPHDKFEDTLALCDSTSPYALTGALFAQDRYALEQGSNALRHSAGNFYINDKSTGAIVGQQPFGGARASGTNDKSGSYLNLLRWVSVRSIKESFVPLTKISYPHMM